GSSRVQGHDRTGDWHVDERRRVASRGECLHRRARQHKLQHQPARSSRVMSLKKLTLVCCLVGVTSILHPPAAQAVDVVNGWSPTTTISSVYSLWSMTLFKLAGTTQTCGHPDFWELPLTDTVGSRTKHAD